MELDDKIKLKEQVIKAIERIEFRKEKAQNAEELYKQFVPIVFYDRLASNNTQIIYGRNGTGKTHLLRSFEYHCNVNYESERKISFYVDAQTLDIGNSTKIEANDLVLIFYKRLINNFISQLQNYFNDEHTITLFGKIFGGESKRKLKNIKRSITEINNVLNLQLIEEKLKTYSREESSEKSLKKKIGGTASASGEANIKNQDVSGKLSFEASAEKQSLTNQEISWVFEGLSIIDYNLIRIQLESIIQECEAISIFLLIDEWSSIDIRLQPVIAEMLKKTLSISQKISIKLVALSYFCNLSKTFETKQRIGLTPGIDIHQLADLDELLNFDINPENVRDFLTAVLYNHVVEYLDEKTRMEDVEQILIEEIFESDIAYLELVRASEGNPRDFLSLLVQCTNVNNFDKFGKIPKINVIKCAAKFFTETKEPVITGDNEASDLFKNIFKHSVSHNQKIFFITISKVDNRIKELWHYRFIHQISPKIVLLDEHLEPLEYEVYSIDYGKLLSLRVHAKGEQYFQKISNIRKTLEMSGIDFTIPDILYKTLVKIKIIDEGKIRKLIGTSFFDVQDIENVQMTKVDELIGKCLIDDLL